MQCASIVQALCKHCFLILREYVGAAVRSSFSGILKLPPDWKTDAVDALSGLRSLRPEICIKGRNRPQKLA